MDRSALRKMALEVFAKGTCVPADLLSAAVALGAREGLGWRDTFIMVEELEKISGLKLKPDNLQSA